MHVVNWWVWSRSAKKWSGHGLPGRPASYTTGLIVSTGERVKGDGNCFFRATSRMVRRTVTLEINRMLRKVFYGIQGYGAHQPLKWKHMQQHLAFNKLSTYSPRKMEMANTTG